MVNVIKKFPLNFSYMNHYIIFKKQLNKIRPEFQNLESYLASGIHI